MSSTLLAMTQAERDRAQVPKQVCARTMNSADPEHRNSHPSSSWFTMLRPYRTVQEGVLARMEF